VESGDDECHVVATVGLSNALAAGDPVGRPLARARSTFLCAVAAPLTAEASLEALALAAEARTAAMLEAQVSSRASGRLASGTGTDCIVLAHPQGEPTVNTAASTPSGDSASARVYAMP
jgi:adenosylcobinamide amidohydrolase